MRVPGCTRAYMTGARSSAYSDRTARARRKIAAREATRPSGLGLRAAPSARAAASRMRATRLVDNPGSLLSRVLLLESGSLRLSPLHASHGPFRVVPDLALGDPRLPGHGDRLPGLQPRDLARHPA